MAHYNYLFHDIYESFHDRVHSCYMQNNYGYVELPYHCCTHQVCIQVPNQKQVKYVGKRCGVVHKMVRYLGEDLGNLDCIDNDGLYALVDYYRLLLPRRDRLLYRLSVPICVFLVRPLVRQNGCNVFGAPMDAVFFSCRFSGM